MEELRFNRKVKRKVRWDDGSFEHLLSLVRKFLLRYNSSDESLEKQFFIKYIKNSKRIDMLIEEGKQMLVFTWGKRLIIMDKAKKEVFVVSFSLETSNYLIYAIPALKDEERVEKLFIGTNWKDVVFRRGLEPRDYVVPYTKKKKIVEKVQSDCKRAAPYLTKFIQ
mgnify:CR=1 FL=1